MITDERLNQMDAEATTITARGTVAGLALGTFVLELTAEVRRLRASLAAEVMARQAAEDKADGNAGGAPRPWSVGPHA